MIQVWLDPPPIVYCTLCRLSEGNQFKNGFPATLALAVVPEQVIGGAPAYRILGVTQEQAWLEARNKGWQMVNSPAPNCDACFFCPGCVALLKEKLR